MSMEDAFEWYHEMKIDTPIVGTREELGLKLIAKYPMQQTVVASNMWVYNYHFYNGKVRYVRMYSVYKIEENGN